MSDRELTEWAAKAAGVEIHPEAGIPCVNKEGWGALAWTPLTDDGDAFRLAVKLNMALSIHDQHCMACAQTGTMQTVRDLPTAEATRRAIVLAAAEIGRGL